MWQHEGDVYHLENDIRAETDDRDADFRSKTILATYHSVVSINNKSKNAPITMQMKKIPASRSIFASAGVL